MAKDDYDFLVFRILTYLYACFQRRCHFETTAFMKRVISQEVSEDYLVDVLRFMTREELIEGLAFVNAWGNDYTLACDYADTLDTVHKLTDTIKNIDKIMMLEDGDYSRTGEWEADMRGSYGRTENYSRGNSYANRGQHYVRGHYSRGDGRERMISDIKNMMQDATGTERDAYKRALDILSSM